MYSQSNSAKFPISSGMGPLKLLFCKRLLIYYRYNNMYHFLWKIKCHILKKIFTCLLN